MKFERDDPLYVSTLRTTRCDASGSFSFTLVADGVWYLTSSVKMAGRLADRGRLDDAASRRTRRKASEGFAPLSTQPQYRDSWIGIISWAVWIGRELEKVHSPSMSFRGDALQVVAFETDLAQPPRQAKP